MKRALTLGIGIVTLATLPALAADLPPRIVTKAPVMVASVYNWSGCYIGGNVGGKWGNTTTDVNSGAVPGNTAAAVSFGRDRTDGTFIGGGQIGCNWQTGAWVFGLEGDADWQRMRQTRTLAGAPPAPFLAGDLFDLRSNWQASARGRVGYAWDRWMLYVTGGAAFTDLSVGNTFIPSLGVPAGSTGSDKKTIVGATLGGGMEYAFSNNWSFGVEARYSWYGNQTFNTGLMTIGPAPLTFAPITQTVRYETFEVTGRLNWKFDWGGPVVARY
jgi:outer membrane immunogenic protein